ncbi:MAG: TPM domain-containing protein [Bacteroidota bacterium]
MRVQRASISFIVTCLFLWAAVAQEQPVAKVSRWVTDATGTLTAGEIRTLEEKLSAFDRSTSTQIVVVIVGTTGDDVIEDAAMKIAEQNGVGTKGKDNGVVLLVAKDDRQMRIEVGYGLEGVLPDALAGTIIRNEITPYFRTGNYYGGISAGVEAIIKATRNEYTADARKKKDGGGGFPLLLVFVILFFVLNGLRRKRGVLGGMAGAILFSGLGGSRRGGGFGGGGFSGGGGSFGGGGASGRW